MQEASNRQNSITDQFTVLLTAVVFGQICPPLLIALPVWAWAYHYTTGWLRNQVVQTTSDKVVNQILVQQPTILFGVCGRLCKFSVTAFILVDMHFEAGPIALYCVASVAAEIVNWCWHQHRIKALKVASTPVLACCNN